MFKRPKEDGGEGWGENGEQHVQHSEDYVSKGYCRIHFFLLYKITQGAMAKMPGPRMS